MFSTPKKGVFKKEILTCKLNWLGPTRTTYVDAERARKKRPGRHGIGALCAFFTCIAVVDFR